MSRFANQRLKTVTAYVPGEQPQERQYIKLNTNESPYPPSPGVTRAAMTESECLQLYSDPDCRALTQQTAAFLGVQPQQILMTNGSDEILNFAFMAFGDAKRPFIFPSVTYGFYSVFADLHGIPYRTIPLQADFTLRPEDYHHAGGNIVIANPNAPTGLTISLTDIEGILQTNREHVVIIDEAYVDFGGQSCLPLLEQYDNLLITRTFSKSYSLAGARLGFGIGSEALIADLNTIKFSTNPYNINRMTMAAGIAALQEADYYRGNCERIIQTRKETKQALLQRGFRVTDSNTNFLFAALPDIPGKTLYEQLKQRGILIRHFDIPEIEMYNRITVGTPSQMQALLKAIDEIIAEGKKA